MDENINKHLHDILDAINEIESFFGDKPKYFNEFCNDLCLRRAVERDIEIIGEAMNRILKEDRNIAINYTCLQIKVLYLTSSHILLRLGTANKFAILSASAYIC